MPLCVPQGTSIGSCHPKLGVCWLPYKLSVMPVESIRDCLLREILLAWFYGTSKYGRERKRSQTTIVLERLWDARSDILPGLPGKQPGWPAGFLPDRSVIWFRRAAALSFLKLPGDWTHADLFYDDGWFHRRTLQMIRAKDYELMRSERRRISENITNLDMLSWITDNLGLTAEMPFILSGVVFSGAALSVREEISSGSIVWLGVRDDDGIGDELLSSTAEWRADRLQSLPKPAIGVG